MQTPPPTASSYDLLGISADGHLQLIIEVKGRVHDKTIGMASQWLQRAGQQEPSLYALFSTPEFMLLRMPTSQRLGKPLMVELVQQQLVLQLQMRLPGQFDYAVNATACLDAAIDTRRIPLNKLTGGGLERTVDS